MSDSVRPHRWQPTRLRCPWDSPGKNTGGGCHFLLQCMKVKSESEVAQSRPALSDPMDCSLPGSSVHGIFSGKSTGVGCHCLLQYICSLIPIYYFILRARGEKTIFKSSYKFPNHMQTYMFNKFDSIRSMYMWLCTYIHIIHTMCIYTLLFIYTFVVIWGFRNGSDRRESACNAGHLGTIPGSERSPGGGNGKPLQYLAWEVPWTEEPGGL